MYLVRIAKKTWDVLAIETSSGRCQVLDFLIDGRGSKTDEENLTTLEAACKSVLAMLQRDIPENGPPTSLPNCRPLGDGVYELRKGADNLRVAFFYDARRVVICALAFSKRSRKETNPRDAVQRAKELRKRYLEDKKRGHIWAPNP